MIKSAILYTIKFMFKRRMTIVLLVALIMLGVQQQVSASPPIQECTAKCIVDDNWLVKECFVLNNVGERVSVDDSGEELNKQCLNTKNPRTEFAPITEIPIAHPCTNPGVAYLKSILDLKNIDMEITNWVPPDVDFAEIYPEAKEELGMYRSRK